MERISSFTLVWLSFYPIIYVPCCRWCPTENIFFLIIPSADGDPDIAVLMYADVVVLSNF